MVGAMRRQQEGLEAEREALAAGAQGRGWRMDNGAFQPCTTDICLHIDARMENGA